MRPLQAILFCCAVAAGTLGQEPAKPSASRLTPTVRYMANANGARLIKPGKERIIQQGTVMRGAGSPASIQIVREFPGRIRIVEGAASPIVVAGVGAEPAKGGGLSDAERDLVETILADSFEEFFRILTETSAYRFLGSRFRADDGRRPGYAGPFYDVYQVLARIAERGSVRVQPKRYYVNSDSLLLDKVRYSLERGGRTEVEVRFEDYQKLDGEFIPQRVIRTENGRTVLTVAITSTAFSPKLTDGLFNRP